MDEGSTRFPYVVLFSDNRQFIGRKDAQKISTRYFEAFAPEAVRGGVMSSCPNLEPDFRSLELICPNLRPIYQLFMVNALRRVSRFFPLGGQFAPNHEQHSHWSFEKPPLARIISS